MMRSFDDERIIEIMDQKYDINNYKIKFITSSKEDEICEKIIEILDLYNKEKIIYIAEDFIDTTESLKKAFSEKVLSFFENDGNKFVLKKFPIIFIEVCEKSELKELLEYWPNSIIQNHYFIVNQDLNLNNLKPKLIIASSLESEHDGFNIFYKESDSYLIEEKLKD